MPYHKQEISALIAVRPKEAVQRIRRAYIDSGASMTATARLLGCAVNTLFGWTAKLEMRDDLAKIREKAKREGWIHPATRRGGNKPDWYKRHFGDAPRTRKSTGDEPGGNTDG